MVDTNASAEESAVPAADASTATAAAAGNPNPASAAAKAGGEAGTSLGTVGTVSHLRVMRYRFCCVIACFVKCVPHFVHQGYPYTYLHHHFSFPFFSIFSFLFLQLKRQCRGVSCACCRRLCRHCSRRCESESCFCCDAIAAAVEGAFAVAAAAAAAAQAGPAKRAPLLVLPLSGTCLRRCSRFLPWLLRLQSLASTSSCCLQWPALRKWLRCLCKTICSHS